MGRDEEGWEGLWREGRVMGIGCAVWHLVLFDLLCNECVSHNADPNVHLLRFRLETS